MLVQIETQEQLDWQAMHRVRDPTDAASHGADQ
jgi:hypothetical protein